MNYHNISKKDMNNGQGFRVVLWTAGCSHNCEGCHNKETHNPKGGIPFDKEALNEIFEELEDKYISGITSAIAKNIVAHREENGAFTSRTDLKKVKGLGPKAFQQCAGFLKVADGKNVLDNTSVHPESYKAAEKLLKLCGFNADDVKNGKVVTLEQIVESRGLETTAEELGIGVPTLEDIVKELTRPGRDPRDELPPPLLRQDVMSMDDLTVGMKLKGTVRNVIDFGAFVDIGVHEDGLVHISRICDRYIKHPLEVLKVGDIVEVYVIGVDVAKKRISLSITEPKK